jgi:Putative Flp pilus-assembly TadE/G-like
MNLRTRERGQILVVFAGGLVLVLAIAALVIDIGFTFLARRAEQNAADPGAIAAARYIRTGSGLTAEPTKMREAACFYAEQNGFFSAAAGNVDACTPANDPNGTVLTVNYPPSTNAGEFAGDPGKVEVVLTRTQQTFLAGIVGIFNIGVASSAVAAFDNGDSNTSSLIALDPGYSCGAGKTHGTGSITIHPVISGALGGYVHVNSTCNQGPPDTICGTNGQGGLDLTGGGNLTAPHTYVTGTCKASGGGALVGTLTEGAVQIGDPLLELPPPPFGIPNPGGQCGIGGPLSTPTSASCGSGSMKWSGTACGVASTCVSLQPGVYYNGWQIANNLTLVLAPGIYVIAGGGVSLNAGGSITSVQGDTGGPAPVLVFNTDNPATHTGQATLDFTATSTLKLHALDSGPYKGILVWNDGKGSNPRAQVTLGGQTSLDLTGTIYSPMGLVKLEGGSGVGSSAAVQVIAWQFDVGGSVTLDMPYDPSQLYQFPMKGLVR